MNQLPRRRRRSPCHLSIICHETQPDHLRVVGDTLKVQIIKINKDTQRISLGMKQLESDPWEAAAEKYAVDTKLSGSVTNITEYGAFV